MEDADTAHAAQPQHDQAAQDSQAEASWRERALNAEDALKAAHAEIRTQRARIGQLLGQLRDAERELTQDAIQRITTENTMLNEAGVPAVSSDLDVSAGSGGLFAPGTTMLPNPDEFARLRHRR